MRRKLLRVVEHREQELPRLGELGDPLRRPDVGGAVVGVREPEQAAEAALDLLPVDAGTRALSKRTSPWPCGASSYPNTVSIRRTVMPGVSRGTRIIDCCL